MSDYRSVLRLAWLVIVGLAVIWAIAHPEWLEPDRLAAWLRSSGAVIPIAFVLLRVFGSVVFLPGSVTAIGAGILFGPLWGVIYNLAASTAGAVLAFSISRFLAPDWVSRHLVNHRHLGRLVRGVEAEGWRFVAFVRLVPLFPYSVLNYALGLTGIRLSHYTLATLIFMIPGDIAFVYLGYAGAEALQGSRTAIRTASIALALLAALAFLPRLVRAYRAQQDEG